MRSLIGGDCSASGVICIGKCEQFVLRTVLTVCVCVGGWVGWWVWVCVRVGVCVLWVQNESVRWWDLDLCSNCSHLRASHLVNVRILGFAISHFSD